MQQRVEIIKVLFREAQFLIFDEPYVTLIGRPTAAPAQSGLLLRIRILIPRR